MAKTIVIFTACFPYGNKNEPFFESELPIMAQHYDTIYILPLYKDGTFVRPVPSNVVVCDILWDNDQPLSYLKVAAGNFFKVASIYLWTLFQKGNFKSYISHVKLYLDDLLREVRYASLIDSFFKEHDMTAPLCYTYWFEGSLLALSILKSTNPKMKIVSRAHRWDLFDEAWGPGIKVPFRDYKMKYINRLVLYSNYAINYVKGEVSPEYHDKIILSYLGVAERMEVPSRVEGEIPLIVSCAQMLPRKRLGPLIDSLKLVAHDVKWIHFGTGPLEKELTEQAASLPPHIKWEFAGHIHNKDLMDFYRRTFVDLFISLSDSEGVPVSFMEAISFGIPVFACRVYGIPDIVNDVTGSLLSVDESAASIAGKIDEMLKSRRYSQDAIRAFSRQNFMDKKNYTEFIQILDGL